MLRHILFLLTISGTLSCQNSKTASAADSRSEIIKESLLSTWHLKEKDALGTEAYSSNPSNLPRVRFREKLEFKPNQQAVKHIAGPTDRPQQLLGKWSWLSDGTMLIAWDTNSTDTLVIEKLNAQQLIFKIK